VNTIKIFAKIGITVTLFTSFYFVGMNSFAETIQCRINCCAPESDLQKNLFEAVKTSNRDLLEAMLSCGLDLRTVDEKGCTPLLVLSDKNCGSGQFDLFAVSDIKEMVADLIKAGAVVDSRDPITEETSLIKVAHIQDLDSAMELVKAGANLNAQDKDGMTPLMRAVEARYLKMVEAFVAAGADLDLKNRIGQTALDIATAHGSSELFDALAGANIVTVQANKEGVCSPMSLVLKLNQPNKIILKTENPMLMLAAKDLNINLMAGAGMDANVTITPQKAGKFVMTCGPQMGDGNPQGSILVQ